MSTAAAHHGKTRSGRPQLAQRATRLVRAAPWGRVLSWAVIVGSLVVIARALPTTQLVELVRQRVEELGPWGPIAFVGIYIVAALLLLPAWTLTLVAGAVFGLLWGTVVASVAATSTAGAAFLIARYLARGRVEKLAQRNRTFGAIDKAIGQGGWRVIALLRLSPAVPFSMGNYLYGLTPVKFWPYLIASWAAMLPGTFLYVYLGYVGKAAAAGGAKSPWQYVLLGVGLLATIAVTVYVTRLARKALKDTGMKGEADEKPRETKRRSPKAPWRLVLAAGVLAVLAACAQLNKERLGSLLGPPKVTPREAYENAPGGAAASFDHSMLSALLREHVSEGGFVDYEGLRADAAELDAYIASISQARVEELGRDERLALLINAYNAFTVRLILEHFPLDSIKDIPSGQRWNAQRWDIGGSRYSLNQIEHELIRPNFTEPRVHFALVCAAIGCPPLRMDAYTGDRIEAQLAEQAQYVHTHPRWFRLHEDDGLVELTALYDWYRGDFEHEASSVVAYAAQYSPDLVRLINAGKEPRVKFLDYSWKLNSVANRQLSGGGA